MDTLIKGAIHRMWECHPLRSNSTPPADVGDADPGPAFGEVRLEVRALLRVLGKGSLAMTDVGSIAQSHNASANRTPSQKN